MELKDYFQYTTGWLLLTSFTTAFGWSFLLGYNIGVLNAPTQVIMAFYNETYTARQGSPVTPHTLNLLWAITVSTFVATGMLGAFFTGLVADFFGRKRGLMFIHSIMFLGVLLESLAQPCGVPELMIVGRSLVGINCGMTVGLASLYLAEIAPRQVRGAVASLHQMAVTLGILISQVLGMRDILGSRNTWPLLCALSLIPAFICMLLLPFCPESPRYLLIRRGNVEGATKALKHLRRNDDFMEEIEEMQQELREGRLDSNNFTIRDLFRRKELRMPLLVAVVLQISQQWSGINAIFFYSESIFKRAGLQPEQIPFAIVGTGVVNVMTTVFSVHLVEKVGRRMLLIGPMLLMTASSVTITASLNLQSRYDWMAYISIACIILFIIGFASGLGSIPPIMCAELFRQEPRSAAMALAQGVNWMCNFLLALTFKFIQAYMRSYTFLLFAVVLALCTTFVAIFVPETKNRTFDEVARDLALGRIVRSLSRLSRISNLVLVNNSVEPMAVTPTAETPDGNLTELPTVTNSVANNNGEPGSVYM